MQAQTERWPDIGAGAQWPRSVQLLWRQGTPGASPRRHLSSGQAGSDAGRLSLRVALSSRQGCLQLLHLACLALQLALLPLELLPQHADLVSVVVGTRLAAGLLCCQPVLQLLHLQQQWQDHASGQSGTSEAWEQHFVWSNLRICNQEGSMIAAQGSKPHGWLLHLQQQWRAGLKVAAAPQRAGSPQQ